LTLIIPLPPPLTARKPFQLDIVGLGSGGINGLTLAAQKILNSAKIAFGYGLYLDQAQPYLKKAQIKKSGMTAEMKRAEEAINSALLGHRTVIVSGGDAGVYAMAGAVFEIAAARKLTLGKTEGQLCITVVPGVPGVVAGAALLGAPLNHDFCLISLSDRLTPWIVIEKRLDMAAQGDFVIVLYNPKSRNRDWQLGRVVEILLERLSPKTPAGIVIRAGRKEQKVFITSLPAIPEAPVDMQTLIIIGNQSTFVYQNHLITPRGYIQKYGLISPQRLHREVKK
jgi:precorrin-3B C17-methyltransferase